MFDKIRSVLLAGQSDSQSDEKDIPELHLAEAALLFHVIAADGKVKPEEVLRMKQVLSERYELNDEDFQELLQAAEQAEREAVDLYRFTSLLTKYFDRDQRIEMIERLWQMVFADGEMHEFEDNVVWRVSQLLHVEAPDRIAMKQKVRNAMNHHDAN